MEIVIKIDAEKEDVQVEKSSNGKTGNALDAVLGGNGLNRLLGSDSDKIHYAEKTGHRIIYHYTDSEGKKSLNRVLTVDVYNEKNTNGPLVCGYDYHAGEMDGSNYKCFRVDRMSKLELVS